MRVGQVSGVLVGIGLMAAPAVFGYAGSTASDLHRLVGPVAASLAAIALWEATISVRWPNVLLAAVLLLAPLVVAHPGGAEPVALLAGTLLAVTTPVGGSRRHRFGGGWSSLLRPQHPDETRRTA